MTLLWQFVALLAGHWVADFVCQTHWMASNKSKDNEALAIHVGVYSSMMLTLALMLLARSWLTLGLVFVLIGTNALLHFYTDYFTSRWSAKWFAAAMQAMQEKWQADRSYGPDAVDTTDPGPRFHNFFVVIGFDQLIHQVTLAVLLVLIFGGAA